MHRQIVYPGAIPLETDLLYTNKFAMVGLAKLAAAVMGGNTYVNGLACTPTSPASMVVNVAPGEIYSLANIDDTAYSSLAADTTHTILKQGIVLDATQFTLTAPSTAGYSTNYLVEACYTDSDGGAVVLPYYNSVNPSSAYNGPNGAGTAQNTYRAGVCTLAIKAGVPATTGTQTTPAVDTGYTALYVITVSQGATSITAANIALAAGAPFLPSNGLIDGIQRKVMTYAADTGAANAYVAQYFPALLSITDGTEVEFKARVANTGASTFNPNGLGASPILTLGGNALTGGEIPAGSQVRVKWNATLSSWLIVSASGITVAQTLANLGLGEGSALPVGVPVPWPSATPPSGWLKCNGAAFTASQYPKLALAYPALKLPDLRGEFLRGWDDGRGIDAGREILTAQGGTLVGFDPVRSDDGLVGVPGVDGANYAAIQGDKLPASVDSVSHLWTALAAGAVNRRAIGYDTAVISRPRNIAFNYIVRAA